MPGYLGALAAVRCLGSYGVEITVAGDELLAPARWSRFTTRFIHSPRPNDAARFLDWLFEFGQREPGHFLYPTSDDAAWLFAANAGELSRRFKLFQPPLDAVVCLLDKQRLHSACAAAGIATVSTWYPQSDHEVERLARELPFPLLIKPRTQVQLRTMIKGVVVREPKLLAREYRAFRRRNAYSPAVKADFGDPSQPMLQSYCAGAMETIYSVAGFVDRQFQLLGARAAFKVLQRPRRVGVGLCFEEAPVEPEIAASLSRICCKVGYYGVFEVEFIFDAGEKRLIDFNPRFYGQMGFEIARGLPLPLFALLAANGDEARLRALAKTAKAPGNHQQVYCDRFLFRFLLTARRLAGGISRQEQARWRQWYADHAGNIVDASLDPADQRPAVVHALSELWRAARHPRGFVRRFLRE
jgi:predicted ATP-grasp superfamily ATP-dependent carboligase